VRSAAAVRLQHLRQIRAPRVALVADACGALAGAIGGERNEIIDDGACRARAARSAAQGIAAGAAALRALEDDGGELANEVGRGERAVAGRWLRP
jgi:hypothetical protein